MELAAADAQPMVWGRRLTVGFVASFDELLIVRVGLTVRPWCSHATVRCGHEFGPPYSVWSGYGGRHGSG